VIEKMARVFKREHSWCVDYRVGNKRITRSFGRDKKQAQLYLGEVERKRTTGELEFIPAKVPLAEFIRLYLERSKIDKAAHTYEVDCSRLGIFQEFLKERGVFYLKGITLEVMEDFKKLLLENPNRLCTPQTFNKSLTLIKTMLNKAVLWKKLAKNPLANFKKMKSRNARQVRYFDDLEIIKILNAADGFLQKVIRILLHTGLRRSELVFLEWSDVKFEDKLIHVQAKPGFGFHTKSDKARSVPINSELEDILNSLAIRGRFVFDNGKGRPLHQPDYYTDQFIKILKKAEIRGASLHTLRHTFTSYLVMAGVDLRTVQELLGHSTVKVTEQYSHLSPDHRARAVGVLNFETKLKQFEPNSSPAPAKSLPFK
jgi:integrase